MGIAAIGNSTTQVSQSNSTAISTLEKKKQQLQDQITKINQEKSGDSKEKQTRIKALQVQVQLIDAQIQQAQAGNTQASNTAATQQSTTSGKKSGTTSLQQFSGTGLDVEA